MKRILAIALPLLAAACSGGDYSAGTVGGGSTYSCAAPMAPSASNQSVVVNVPSDFDSSATPTPTATTTINFTVMLPTRCPGDHYPLVLQSHGYGGTRLKTVGPNGNLDPTLAHFPSINQLVQALPFHGYVVISYDERGHGTPVPGTAAHNARTIDPGAETQDAIALLDWAYDNADAFFIQRETGTGIAKDIRVGTIGYSYGGGFEMPLALLDARVDTMVPNGTWNNLLYSLVPGDAVKLGFDSLLCLLAEPDPTNAVGGNVNNTPLVAALCNLIGPQGASAASLRTRADLATAATTIGSPRNARDEDELLNYFYSHGSRFFENQQRDGKTLNAADWPGYVSLALNGITGTPLSAGVTIPDSASRRAIPVLFLQGNRDVLFNLTDAYFNYQYFKGAGGDVRLLTTEGGHMNPLAQQKEGSANCGGVIGPQAILAWFDEKLKNIHSVTYTATPQVCISVAATPAAGATPANADLRGVLLSDIPVGSLSGVAGAIATAGDVAETTVTSANTPVFVPVGSPITAANAVLAGIPRVGRVTINSVTGVAPPPGTPTPIAYVGVGIQRGGNLILVDDEVTPFAMTDPPNGTTTDGCSSPPAAPAIAHCNNRGMGNAEILLPGVGEMLQNGDQLGLLLYDNQVQYLPANNAGTAAQTGQPNPYKVTFTNVQLPVFIPGTYAGSTLSQP